MRARRWRRFDERPWARNLFDGQYATSSPALVGTGGARTMRHASFLGEQRTRGITASARF